MGTKTKPTGHDARCVRRGPSPSVAHVAVNFDKKVKGNVTPTLVAHVSSSPVQCPAQKADLKGTLDLNALHLEADLDRNCSRETKKRVQFMLNSFNRDLITRNFIADARSISTKVRAVPGAVHVVISGPSAADDACLQHLKIDPAIGRMESYVDMEKGHFTLTSYE